MSFHKESHFLSVLSFREHLGVLAPSNLDIFLLQIFGTWKHNLFHVEHVLCIKPILMPFFFCFLFGEMVSTINFCFLVLNNIALSSSSAPSFMKTCY